MLLGQPGFVFFEVAKNPSIDHVIFRNVFVEVLQYGPIPAKASGWVKDDMLSPRHTTKFKVMLKPANGKYTATSVDLSEEIITFAKTNDLPAPFLLEMDATENGIYTIACSVTLSYREREISYRVSDDFRVAKMGVTEEKLKFPEEPDVPIKKAPSRIEPIPEEISITPKAMKKKP